MPVSSTPGAPTTLSDHEAYQRWIAAREPDEAQLELQRRIAGRVGFRPLISVITPVFNPPPDILAQTIASVRAQTYDHWELVLVNAGCDRPGVRELMVEASRDEARIVLVDLDANRGISENTNQGLHVARGDFVAFLDHDDLYAPATLFEVVRLLNEDPSLEVIYFDEDKLSADGTVRMEPLFKPAWSPDLLLSLNFLMHSVVRRSVLEEVGGLDPTMDGAQDWDLALRLSERGVRAARIPRVLYHWRKVPGSAAADATAKMWAYEAQRRCLRDHLERRGLADVRVESPTLGVVRPRWRASGAKASLIIPTKEKAQLVKNCVTSLLERTSYENYEILLIDTGSADRKTLDYYATLEHEPRVRLLKYQGAFNYSRVNNFGAAQATGDVLVFLNNDIEALDRDWLDELVRWAELPGVGCVGAKLLYPSAALQHAGIVVGLLGHGSHVFRNGSGEHRWGVFGSPEFYRDYVALTGACLAIRRDLFEQLGGLDEAYELCYSDIDLCLRAAESGLRVVYTPYARLTHHEGGTRGLHFPSDDVLRASVKMFPLIVQGDPYFSPNLSYQSLEPRIAIGDNFEARSALIMSIAESFHVRERLTEALERELLGSAGEWRVYSRLVSTNTPPALPAPASADGEPPKPRILVVTHDLSRSGAPMVASHLTRYLCRKGCRVTVLSPTDGRMREVFEEAGARVTISPLALDAPYALSDLLAGNDIVIANTILTWRMVLAAKSRGCKVLWLVHESLFGLEYLEANPLAVEAMALADSVVFPSHETLHLFKRFDGGNQQAINYGFDRPSVGTAIPAREGGKLRVLVVGSVEPRKGQDLVLACAARLPNDIQSKTEFQLMGRILDGEFASRLQTQAAALGHVEFLPEGSHEEVLRRVAAADVLLCSSRDETGPLVVMEAMGLGKAVISTRVGAVPDIIEDGLSGLIVGKEDAQGMADALVRLHRDSAMLERLGSRARDRFESYLTLERYGDEIMGELARISDRTAAWLAATRRDGV